MAETGKPEDLQKVKEQPFRDDISTDPPAPRGLWLTSKIRRAVAYLFGWDGSQFRRIRVESLDPYPIKAAAYASYYGTELRLIKINSVGGIFTSIRGSSPTGSSFTAGVSDRNRLMVDSRFGMIDGVSAATVTVTDSGGQLVAANADRVSVKVRNVGSEPVLISTDSSPSASNAFRLRGGDEIEIRNPSAIYAICETAGSSSDVAYWEETCST